MEATTCIINKRPSSFLIPVSTTLHILLFTVSPILTYFWYYFIRNLLFNSSKISKFMQRFLLIPILINFISTILSPIFHLVFYIDKNNVYHRGNFFYLYTIITYIYIILGLLFILKNIKKMTSKEFIPLIILGVLPVIGALVQMFFYGVLLMWSSVAFALVIVYIFLQQRMVHLDYLTGTWDRSSFDYYISQRITKNSNYKTGIIYMDIDNLKIINDSYGHAEGDFVLKKSVELIKSSLRKEDLMARIGGDEFIIILEAENKKSILGIIKKLEDIIYQYNIASKKNYSFSCSFGGSVFDSSKECIDEFLRHIDKLMYENKSKKRELN